MAEGGGGGGGGGLATSEGPKRPSISLPPRSTVESLFRGGVAEASPGPMTLVSSFFAEDPESECRSFSQLLAGAMASPAAITAARTSVETMVADVRWKGGGEDERGRTSLNLGHSRPMNLLVAQSPYFTVPPGLSPGGLLDSPAMFSNLGQFGMSHQQALAQVTAQAAHSHAQIHSQTEYPSSLPSASLTQQVSTMNMATTQPVQSITSSSYNSGSALMSHCDQKAQPTALVVDKPVDDGYNWRKYGQKQVKGSGFPRSYYKCTHPKCPVKKKVERSMDGHVTEIIYKGQHNHQKPPPNKRSKDGTAEFSGSSDPNNADSRTQGDISYLNRSSEGSKRSRESVHGASEQLTGSSDAEELGDAEAGVDEAEYSGESEQKRRNLETRVIESAASHRMVTEPRIIVQTTSEVDLLDDGYRWRKYGQKVVKGNPHPRSYYKCTHAGCNVRKHVERASTDAKAVITTYEGKHNHDVPAARNSSHNTHPYALPPNRNNSAPHQIDSNNQFINEISDLRNNVQRPIAVLQLKAEHEMT